MLQKVKDDYYEGKYDEIVLLLNNFILTKQFTDYSETEQMLLYYYFTISYAHIGKSEIALKLIHQAKDKYTGFETTEEYLSLIASETNLHAQLGRLDQGIEICNKTLQSINIVDSNDS